MYLITKSFYFSNFFDCMANLFVHVLSDKNSTKETNMHG